MVKFGGHKGAAGMTIRRPDFERFAEAFEHAVQKQVLPQDVGPVLWTDGEFHGSLDLGFLEHLNKLLPFGREFEAPLFEAYCKIVNLRPVGQDGSHLQISLECSNKQVLAAIWFNACEPGGPLTFAVEDRVHVVFSLGENVFREQRSLQCQIHYLQPIPS
jgi:single-stranded-DNA-specific exonuclease